MAESKSTTPPRAPRRIALSRKRGWRMPKGAIRVDRSTVFGNPFRPGGPNLLGWGTVRDAEHAVYLHRQWLVTPARFIAVEAERHETVLRALPGLAGHDLACWCPVDARHCHADTLLELANRPDIAQVVAALLHPQAGWSHIIRAVALGQLGRLLDLGPTDVARLGASVTALAAQIRDARTPTTEPTTQEPES